MSIALLKQGQYRKSLKVRLDKLVPIYVKLRDMSEGFFDCISCYKSHGFGENGHYIRRGIESVRWHPLNNNLQCIDCNRDRGGNTDAYRVGLVERYGEDEVLELEKESNEFAYFSIEELEGMIEIFENKIHELGIFSI